MESSQKAVKQTAARDKTQMATLLESMRYLVETLNNSYHVMRNFSVLAQTYKAPDILSDDIIEVRKDT